MGSLGGVSQEEGSRTKALERTELELVISKEQKKGPGGWNTVSQTESGRRGGGVSRDQSLWAVRAK